MTMTELREAFAAWKLGDTNSDAILFTLRDPTPITEAGLRELGYMQSLAFSSLWLSKDMPTVEKTRNGNWELNGVDGYIKTLGQLRGLLLFVGELFEAWMRNELDPTLTPKSDATRRGSVQSDAKRRVKR